jgi:hypothetical protein
MKSGAPVGPLKITSEYKIFGKILINIGPAVDLAAFRDKKIRSETLEKVTDSIMNEISRL